MNIKNLQTHIPLAPYTTFKIGGPADYFLRAQTPEEIIAGLKTARESGISTFILGTGANILVGDKGFRGLVIHNQTSRITITDRHLIAQSGVIMADLIETAATHGLSGLEHFAGIPSSVGGALWQNLHFLSPDRQHTLFIGDSLTQATILDPDLNVRIVDRGFFTFGYDYSLLHDLPITVLEATFALNAGYEIDIRRQIEANLEWRRQKHPDINQFPSAGSVFKKIESVGAGRLIDQAGLRGIRIGDAQISEKHTNFIVNLGHATAMDVRNLIKLVQAKVQASTGYFLQPEIQFIGDF